MPDLYEQHIVIMEVELRLIAIPVDCKIMSIVSHEH